jgi:hypothetical protein
MVAMSIFTAAVGEISVRMGQTLDRPDLPAKCVAPRPRTQPRKVDGAHSRRLVCKHAAAIAGPSCCAGSARVLTLRRLLLPDSLVS